MSKAVSMALAAHISWSLKLDEEQAIKICNIVGQWSGDLGEGAAQFAACESPAERLFLLGFLLALPKDPEKWPNGDRPVAKMSWLPECEPDCESEGKMSDYLLGGIKYIGRDFDIYAQRRIGDYRVDFAIEPIDLASYDPTFWGVAIEIDGHDFHEKTKAQASADRERDRFVQSEGYNILRFTGSDIYKSPALAAEEVLLFASGLAMRRELVTKRIERDCIKALESAGAPPKQLPPAPTSEAAE